MHRKLKRLVQNRIETLFLQSMGSTAPSLGAASRSGGLGTERREAKRDAAGPCNQHRS